MDEATPSQPSRSLLSTQLSDLAASRSPRSATRPHPRAVRTRLKADRSGKQRRRFSSRKKKKRIHERTNRSENGSENSRRLNPQVDKIRVSTYEESVTDDPRRSRPSCRQLEKRTETFISAQPRHPEVCFANLPAAPTERDRDVDGRIARCGMFSQFAQRNVSSK